MTEKAGIRIENPTIKKEESFPVGYVIVLAAACFVVAVGAYLVVSELLHLPLPGFVADAIHSLISLFKG